ncbi:hypothetical protein [Rhizobium ruizarguesonis]|uniref:hypothetical protein n=1 Tax=Rhizobium ruizarguesonis TaxID=2081791 RepID=UPI0013EEF55E|nr:hypothetical protein [Rhizobium ruizarguesonis]
MKFLSGLVAFALVAILALAPAIAEARSSFGGFRGGSSFRSSSSFSSRSTTTYSRPSTSYSRPSTTYRPAPVYSSPSYRSYSSTTTNQSSGGGFFSSMLGSIAGYGIAQWLFGEDEKPAEQAPAATSAPAAQAPVTGAVPTTTVQEAPKAQ